MNAYLEKTWCRVLAALLCLASLTLSFLCLRNVGWIAANGGYGLDGSKQLLERQEEQLVNSYTADLKAYWENNWLDTDLDKLKRDVSSWDPNFFFVIRDEEGKSIVESSTLGDYREKAAYSGFGAMTSQTEELTRSYVTEQAKEEGLSQLQTEYDEVIVNEETQLANDVWKIRVSATNYEDEGASEISGFLRSQLQPNGNIYWTLAHAGNLGENRYLLLLGLVASAVVGIASLVFLVRANKRQGQRGDLSEVDRMPPDLTALLGLLGLVFVGVGLIVDQSFLMIFPFESVLCLSLGLLAAGVALFSLFRRHLAGSLGERTFFAFLVRGLKKIWKKLVEVSTSLFRSLPLFWSVLVAFGLLTVLEGILLMQVYYGNGVYLIWLVVKILEGGLVVWVALSMVSLREGGRQLAQGNLAYQVPLEKLKGPFAEHGENLNNIRAAIQTAVEEQMKSERMKTELITNVSHDIKTPLTSIVSYVDLLQKQPMATPQAKEYLEVLERQAARLKKLTEDLVEASKAATGNLKVDLQPTDVNVLLTQTAGEYQERLAAKNLELLLTPAPSPAMILADGKHLWRMFENLFGNILKYALPGTRVYLTCESGEETVRITFRNISAAPLNISSEELMARFVRGDESRSTEGSGLGLSITQSLAGLQKGRFDVEIDGDLFKAILTFPKLPREK